MTESELEEIDCTIYNDFFQNILEAPGCIIPAGTLESGKNYYMLYTWKADEFSDTVADFIELKTIITDPSCRIAGMPGVLYFKNVDNLLDANVTNERTDFEYKWSCEPLGDGQCDLNQRVAQNGPDLTVYGANFEPDFAQFQMTLNIMIGDNVLSSCSATVEKVPDEP